MKNSSCGHNMTEWEEVMNKLYTYFYLLLFIPGLLLNSVALWVLCRYIRKNTKSVIFMINLALADLIHILTLPLRIFYYLTHMWPFGQNICLLCFYLKYLNMYASIGFLVCISVQRCVFLLRPFSTRRWRSRYDLVISVSVWVLAAVACSPFILMRTSSSRTYVSHFMLNKSSLTDNPFIQQPAASVLPNTTWSAFSLGESGQFFKTNATQVHCFKDLPTRPISHSLAVTLMVMAELFGFLIPLAFIGCSSIFISRSLYQKTGQVLRRPARNCSIQGRLSFTCADENNEKKQTNGEKRRALRMVLSCSAVFLLCFGPYHINFLLYLLVQQDLLLDCSTRLAVRQFHPVSLCLASLNCCLNPLLYYFLTAEFRFHLSRRHLSLHSLKFSRLHRLLSSESGSFNKE
ncbi:putative P2Y purinoceptor 10 [Stigmatopora argus]